MPDGGDEKRKGEPESITVRPDGKKTERYLAGFEIGKEDAVNFLKVAGVTEGDIEELSFFFREASTPQLSDLRDRMVQRVSAETMDGDGEVEIRARQYLQVAGSTSKTVLSHEGALAVKAFMRETGNDILALAAALAAPEDKIARLTVYKLLTHILYVSAREQGIAIGGLNTQDSKSSWAGKRYPVLVAPEGERRVGLVKILTEEVKSLMIPAEGESLEPDSQFMDIEAAYEAIRGVVCEGLQVFGDQAQGSGVEVDFNDLYQEVWQGRFDHKVERRKIDEDELLRLAIQQFHPETGEYWEIEDSLEAARRLEAFLDGYKGVGKLPQEIQMMLAYATLAPNRGIWVTGEIGMYGSMTDFRGMMAVLANCPEELRPLKESAIKNMVDQQMSRDIAAEVEQEKKGINNLRLSSWNDKEQRKNRIYRQRENVVSLLLLGLMPRVSPVYLRYFFEQRKKFDPKGEAALGGIDLMMLAFGADENPKFGPYSDVTESYGHQGNFSLSWCPEVWFWRFRDPEARYQSAEIRRVKFLEGNPEVSETCMRQMAAYVEEAGDDHEERIRRVVRMTEAESNGAVVSGKWIERIYEEMLKVPDGFTFDFDYSVRLSNNAWFEEPTEWLREIEVDGKRKLVVSQAKSRQMYEKVVRQRTEKRRITQELLTGADMNLGVIVEFERLRQDPEYREWEEGVRAEFEQMLKGVRPAEANPGFRLSSLYFNTYSATEWSRKNIRDLMLGTKKGRLNHYYYLENLIESNLIRKLKFSDLSEAMDFVSAEVTPQQISALYLPEDPEKTENQTFFLPIGRSIHSYYGSEHETAFHNLTPERAREIVGLLTGWEARLEAFEALKFFAEVINFKELRKELVEVKRRMGIKAETENKKELGYSDDPQSFSAPQVENFFGAMTDILGLVDFRKKKGIVVNRDERQLKVEGSVSVRLARELGIFFSGSSRHTLSDIVPTTTVIRRGECRMLTGPTGCGKTARAEAIIHPFYLSEMHSPLAQRVTVPEGDHFVFNRVGMSGFKREERAGQSLFMGSAQESAQIALREIVAMSEPGMGAPTKYRVPLVAADALERVFREDAVVLETHEGVAITRIFNIMGMGDRLTSEYITPDEKHEAYPGIGGSYGLEMLAMQGASPQFVEIVKAFRDADEVNVPEGQLALESRELPPTKETEFASRKVLEAGHFTGEGTRDDALMFFVERAGGKPTLARRIGRVFEAVVNEEGSRGEQLVTKYEEMELNTHKEIVEGIKLLESLIEESSGSRGRIEYAEKAIKGRYTTEDLPEIAKLFTFDPAKMFRNPDQVKLMKQAAGEIEGDDKERALAVLEELETASESLDLDYEADAFNASWEKVSKWDRERNINDIERVVKGALGVRNLPEDWQLMITRARETVEGKDHSASFELFKKFIGEHADSLSNLNYEGRRMLDCMIKAKEKVWKEIFSIGESRKGEEESPRRKFTANLKDLGEIADRRIDEMTFGAVIAYSTRIDNQSEFVKFCIPEEVQEVESMPFPQQIYRGTNLYLASSLGEGGVVPQNLFTQDDGERMGFGDFRDGETGEVMTETTRCLMFTGVQGGGKTESVRMSLQMELLRKAIGRVPAEKAWMAPKPKAVVAKLKPATTEGTDSTFTAEAKRIVELEPLISQGVMLFCDEPGNGTVEEEITAITSALGYLAAKKRAFLVSTNHEMGVYRSWERLNQESRIPWMPVAYEYTDDPEKKYKLRYRKIGGAETFRIAAEQGIDKNTIRMAEFIFRVQGEFEEHKTRLFQ